jgi:hypothetical protein
MVFQKTKLLKMDVKIRFNTSASDLKWRIIVDDTEHLVDEIEIKCKSFTTGDLLSCKAKNVSFKTKKNQKIAIVL